MKRRGAIHLSLLLALASVTAAGQTADERIGRVEKGLFPPLPMQGEKNGWSLPERMRHYNVPGVSIAVLHDFKLAWAESYGVRDAETGEPVTESTPFQASSLSMPVTSMAALKLVQDGKLSLDRGINESLRTWKHPENDLTGKSPVTLKRLLSHGGAISIARLPGYAPDEPLPTLLDLLLGRKPSKTVPVRVFAEPGRRYSYSIGGYLIVQQALEDVTGRPFGAVAREAVFAPLQMEDSTFEQPLPAERLKQAASGHRGDGKPLPGKVRIYPETAAVGLWTSARDLARLVLDLQLALRDGSGKVLSHDSADAMLTGWADTGFGFRMGLGFFIDRNSRVGYLEQRGANEGFQCLVVAHRTKGYGAVVMTNSDNGLALAGEIVRSIAREYGWEGYLLDGLLSRLDLPRHPLHHLIDRDIRGVDEGVAVVAGEG